MSAEKLFAGSQPSPRSRPRGWWYPWIFVGFFFLTFGVNGALVYFAMSTWTGLETHYWQRGTAYNAALAGARQQRERGWQVGIDFQAADIKSAHLAISLKDQHGNNLTGAKVTAKLLRPTSEGHDFTIELAYAGDGRYAADFALPLPGQWDIRVIADHPQGDYQDVKRIVVKG